VLRTSCSGLGTQVTPKAAVGSLQSPRMAASQSKLQLKRKRCLLRLAAIFAGTPANGFAKNLTPLLSCLVQLGRFDFIFYPAGLRTKLTSQLVLARAYGRLCPLRGD
jgi:hypothetical protein